MTRRLGAGMCFSLLLGISVAHAASHSDALHGKTALHRLHAKHGSHVAREREDDHVVYSLPEATRAPARLSALAGNDKEAWNSVRKLRPIAWRKHRKLPPH